MGVVEDCCTDGAWDRGLDVLPRSAVLREVSCLSPLTKYTNNPLQPSQHTNPPLHQPHILNRLPLNLHILNPLPRPPLLPPHLLPSRQNHDAPPLRNALPPLRHRDPRFRRRRWRPSSHIREIQAATRIFLCFYVRGFWPMYASRCWYFTGSVRAVPVSCRDRAGIEYECFASCYYGAVGGERRCYCHGHVQLHTHVWIYLGRYDIEYHLQLGV